MKEATKNINLLFSIMDSASFSYIVENSNTVELKNSQKALAGARTYSPTDIVAWVDVTRQTKTGGGEKAIWLEPKWHPKQISKA